MAHQLRKRMAREIGRPGRGLLVTALGAVALLAGCGTSTVAVGSSPTSPHGVSVAAGCLPASSATASASATTPSYVMALDVGPLQDMYTQAEASANAQLSGEVMISGQMANVPGMPMSSGGAMPSSAPVQDRHLEVHICSKGSGQVVQNAQPTITLTDDTMHSSAETVPVAVMEGVGQGVGDLHYGNNVVMQPGDTYTVVVAVGSEQASVKLTMPAGSPTPTATPRPSASGGGMGM